MNNMYFLPFTETSVKGHNNSWLHSTAILFAFFAVFSVNHLIFLGWKIWKTCLLSCSISNPITCQSLNNFHSFSETQKGTEIVHNFHSRDQFSWSYLLPALLCSVLSTTELGSLTLEMAVHLYRRWLELFSLSLTSWELIMFGLFTQHLCYWSSLGQSWLFTY